MPTFGTKPEAQMSAQMTDAQYMRVLLLKHIKPNQIRVLHTRKRKEK